MGAAESFRVQILSDFGIPCFDFVFSQSTSNTNYFPFQLMEELKYMCISF